MFWEKNINPASKIKGLLPHLPKPASTPLGSQYLTKIMRRFLTFLKFNILKFFILKLNSNIWRCDSVPWID